MLTTTCNRCPLLIDFSRNTLVLVPVLPHASGASAPVGFREGSTPFHSTPMTVITVPFRFFFSRLKNWNGCKLFKLRSGTSVSLVLTFCCPSLATPQHKVVRAAVRQKTPSSLHSLSLTLSLYAGSLAILSGPTKVRTFE